MTNAPLTEAAVWRARAEKAEAARDEWRRDFRALEKAIVGDTGLSAMVVALQARKYRPRAERAEAALATARDDALEDSAHVAESYEYSFQSATIAAIRALAGDKP